MKTSYYCPYCGKQNMWIESGEDYYLGSTTTCDDCGERTFNLDSMTTEEYQEGFKKLYG